MEKIGTIKLCFGDLTSIDREHEKFSLCFKEDSTEQAIVNVYKQVDDLNMKIIPSKLDIIGYSISIDGDIPKGWERFDDEIKMLAKQQSANNVPKISHIPNDKITDFSYPRCKRIFKLLNYAILKATFPEYFKDSRLKFIDRYYDEPFSDVRIENPDFNLLREEMLKDNEGKYYLTLGLGHNTKLSLDTIDKIWLSTKKKISPYSAAKSLVMKEGVLAEISRAEANNTVLISRASF